MNKLRSLLLILSFVIGQLQKSGLLNYSKLQNNVSHNTNLYVQKVMNKLFTILKLKDTFKTRSKTVKFLDFYETMRKIASNNWKMFEEMKYLIKISDNRTNNITLFKLNDLLREIVRDEHFKLLSKVKAVTLDSRQAHYTETTEFKVLDETALNNRTQENIELGIDFPKAIRRIFNGEPATVAKYPFVVSVHVMGLFFCAGSIISKHHVITAASCIIIDGTSSRGPNIFLRIGSDYAVQSGAVIPISTVHFHPKYDVYTLKNNLAILTTEKPFNFVNSKIKKIKYEQNLNEDDANSLTNIRILGWGAKDKDSVFKINFGRLSSAELSVYDFEECTAIYSSHYMSETNFCAGFVTKGGGACNGDVGGPGIRNGILVGVVSYGAPVCGIADSPTVFTRLGYYEKWISNVTNEKPSSSKMQSRKTRKPTKLKTTKKYTTKTTSEAYYSTKGIMSDDADYTDDTETVIERKNEITRTFYKNLSGILREVIKEIASSHDTLDIDNYLYADYNEENLDTFSPTTEFDFREDPMINFVNQLTTVFPTEDPDFAPMDKPPDYWDRQKTLTLPTALPRFLPTTPYFFIPPQVDDRDANSRRLLRDNDDDIDRRIENILESSTILPNGLKRRGLNANDYLAYFY